MRGVVGTCRYKRVVYVPVDVVIVRYSLVFPFTFYDCLCRLSLSPLIMSCCVVTRYLLTQNQCEASKY